jgi:hypothetical protein
VQVVQHTRVLVGEGVSARRRGVYGVARAVRVTDAAVQDRDGGIDLVRGIRASFPWIGMIVLIWATTYLTQ